MLKQAGYVALFAVLLFLIFKRQRSIARETFDDEYDFIVVGGGTTGAAVASRLSETNAKTLVLEAGDEDYFDPLTSVPVLGLFSPGTSRDWQYMIEPQKDVCKNMLDNKIRWPRGKILGGSSSINYMLFVRACKDDLASWVDAGAEGWSYEDVLPYYKKSENYIIPELHDSPYHGKNGRITVQRTNKIPMSSVFMEAAEELGFPILDDYNGESMDGFAYFHQTIKDGYRQNSATAYLRPVAYSRQDHLHIVVRARVTKILFDDKKNAVGVEMERDGKQYTIKAKKEIILSAGAIENPHILMLSGIGPKKHLQDNKITVVSDLPGVGSNLEDHVMVPTFFHAPNISHKLLSTKTMMFSTLEYLLHGTGLIAGSISDSFATIRFNNSRLPQSQLFFGGLEMDVETFRTMYMTVGNLHPEMYSAAAKKAEEQREGIVYSFYIVSVLSHAKSLGTIRLNSTDPSNKPIIDPKYFKHPDDMKNMIESMKLVKRLSETKAFKDVKAQQVMLYDTCDALDGDEKYKCVTRHETFTSFHPCCTAKMGRDKMSVVNPKLKVYGVNRLRIADASVMPHDLTGPLQATCYMIAERLADWIKSDWKLENDI